MTPSAQQDLDTIQDYLLARSDEASRIVGDGLARAFERLAEFPLIGHARPDLTERPVLFYTVYSYLIVYDPAPKPVRVLRIIHAARDLREVSL